MYRVLLADDEPIIRENVSRHVPWEAHGFQLAGSCQNGREVLRYIEEHPVDLLITDICMPFMDGMELCRQLYENYPRTKIVLLSGYDDFAYAKKAIRYHVAEYILKPVTSREMCELLDRIRDILDRERQQEQNLAQLETSYRDNYLNVRSNALADFITGSKSLKESTRELGQLGLSVWEHAFSVAVLEPNMFSRDIVTDRSMQQESSLTAFIVFNVAMELVSEESAGVVCQDKNRHTLILFHDDSEASTQRNLSLCRKIMYHLKETAGLKVTIGLGSQAPCAEQIPRSCSEAKYALTYRYLKGDNQVISFSSLPADHETAPDKKLAEALSNAVRNTDGRALEHAIYSISEEIMSHLYTKEKCSMLLSWGAEMCCDILRNYNLAQEDEKNRTITAILQAGTFPEAVDIVRTYAEGCMDALRNNRRKGGRNYIVAAMEYIEQNYNNPDMSLKNICSHLGISTSRFSSLFKSETGKTFMDVLTQIRMEQAKQLLANTNLKNYEIAERVGFSDSHYFGIAFKKETGQTPTEYARRIKETAGYGKEQSHEEEV